MNFIECDGEKLPDFLFYYDDSQTSNIPPTASFDPASALDGQPFRSATAPSIDPNLRTLIISKDSFFATDCSYAKYIAFIKRLKLCGFKIFIKAEVGEANKFHEIDDDLSNITDYLDNLEFFDKKQDDELISLEHSVEVDKSCLIEIDKYYDIDIALSENDCLDKNSITHGFSKVFAKDHLEHFYSLPDDEEEAKSYLEKIVQEEYNYHLFCFLLTNDNSKDFSYLNKFIETNYNNTKESGMPNVALMKDLENGRINEIVTIVERNYKYDSHTKKFDRIKLPLFNKKKSILETLDNITNYIEDIEKEFFKSCYKHPDIQKEFLQRAICEITEDKKYEDIARLFKTILTRGNEDLMSQFLDKNPYENYKFYFITTGAKLIGLLSKFPNSFRKFCDKAEVFLQEKIHGLNKKEGYEDILQLFQNILRYGSENLINQFLEEDISREQIAHIIKINNNSLNRLSRFPNAYRKFCNKAKDFLQEGINKIAEKKEYRSFPKLFEYVLKYGDEKMVNQLLENEHYRNPYFFDNAYNIDYFSKFPNLLEKFCEKYEVIINENAYMSVNDILSILIKIDKDSSISFIQNKFNIFISNSREVEYLEYGIMNLLSLVFDIEELLDWVILELDKNKLLDNSLLNEFITSIQTYCKDPGYLKAFQKLHHLSFRRLDKKLSKPKRSVLSPNDNYRASIAYDINSILGNELSISQVQLDFSSIRQIDHFFDLEAINSELKFRALLLGKITKKAKKSQKVTLLKVKKLERKDNIDLILENIDVKNIVSIDIRKTSLELALILFTRLPNLIYIEVDKKLHQEIYARAPYLISKFTINSVLINSVLKSNRIIEIAKRDQPRKEIRKGGDIDINYKMVEAGKILSGDIEATDLRIRNGINIVQIESKLEQSLHIPISYKKQKIEIVTDENINYGTVPNQIQTIL